MGGILLGLGLVMEVMCIPIAYTYTCTLIVFTLQDADLRSAVCVEQAAHAFLRIQPTMPRKYALHLILAGHRYAKVAQVCTLIVCTHTV